MEYLKEYKFFKTPGDYSEKDPDEPFFNVNKGKYRREKREQKKLSDERRITGNLQNIFNMDQDELLGYLTQIGYNKYGYSVGDNTLSIGDEPYDDWDYTITKYDENYFILRGTGKKIKSDTIQKLLQYLVNYVKDSEQQNLDDEKSFDEEI